FASPTEVVEERQHVGGSGLCPLGVDDGVDGLGCTEDALRVLEVLEVVGGPHPVWTPAGDDDRLLALHRPVQGRGHRCVRTVEQVEVETVDRQCAVTGCHQTSPRIDAYHLATEQIGVVVEIGDAVDGNVRRHGPTDIGAFEVRTEVDEGRPILSPVRLVSGGQPGSHYGVEVALCHSDPHGTGVDGGEVDVVAQLVAEYRSYDVRRRYLGIPQYVTQLNGFILSEGGTN